MPLASQEMEDLLREVQKLQKELQPVKSAVTALKKREAEVPNAAAAGASLKKIANRLKSVRLKYAPYLKRLHELVTDEVPAYLQQTPLLTVDAAALEEVVAKKRASGAATDSVGPNAQDAAHTSAKKNPSAAPALSAVAKHAMEEAASLIEQVCPPSTPHLLQPENLLFAQQQLRLRAEMVEYLIETDRLDIAEHVTRAYEMPIQWFPQLVLLHRERSFGAAVDTLDSSQNPLSGTGTLTGLSRSLPMPNASPLVTPAMKPRSSGVLPKSPVQLPAPVRAKGGANGPSGTSRSRFPTSPPSSMTPAGTSRSTASPAKQNSPSPGHMPRTPQHTSQEENSGNVFVASSSMEAELSSAPMPDLVARVVSTALYLKDEYVDRMVLERMLEQHLGTAPCAESSSSSTAKGGSGASPSLSSTPAERYRACVLSRIANIPRRHLHTQSGDDSFDHVMMNIIEDLLVYSLQKWAEEDSSTTSGDAEDAAAESKRKEELLRTLTTDTILTSEEMLIADKVWNEDILFLKRPTRFYCVESGLSSDDAAGSTFGAPRARANGEIVSKCVAANHDSLDDTVGLFIT